MRGIVVRGSLGAREVLWCERTGDSGADVVIDLRGMTWCDPAGLVIIAALAGEAVTGDQDVVLHGPTNVNVANYLGRMRLGRVLDELGAAHDVPVVRERPLETSLVELISLIDEDDCDSAAADVRETTAAKCGETVADRLYETLIEAVQNVVHHSRASAGYLTAQAFPTKQIVRFAVADAGIGLRRSLRSRGAESDESAIALALAGTSRLDDRGRGDGFPTMREITDAAGGRLEVVSGRARYNGRRVVGSQREAFDGTLIQGTLSFAT